jgi:hypothetical protein
MLRDVSRYDPIVRISISAIKKEVSQSNWDILVDKKAPTGINYEDMIKKVHNLFDNPNLNGESFRTLQDRVIEDILVLDS